MTLKPLIKPFSHNEIKEEFNKQGWMLPTLEQVRSCELTYDVILVAGESDDPKDHGTHGLVYYRKSDTVGIVNNKVQLHVEVVVIPKVCSNCEYNVDEVCMNTDTPVKYLETFIFSDFGCTCHIFLDVDDG